MSFTEMFVSCGILHFRGGWVGIAHSRFCDVFLDLAQLILRFPPWMGGKCLQSWWLSMNAKMMRSKQFGMQQCNADEMLCNIHFQDRYPLWSLSQKTSAACFRFGCAHVSGLRFLEKQPNKLFDTTCFCIWMHVFAICICYTYDHVASTFTSSHVLCGFAKVAEIQKKQVLM